MTFREEYSSKICYQKLSSVYPRDLGLSQQTSEIPSFRGCRVLTLHIPHSATELHHKITHSGMMAPKYKHLAHIKNCYKDSEEKLQIILFPMQTVFMLQFPFMNTAIILPLPLLPLPLHPSPLLIQLAPFKGTPS